VLGGYAVDGRSTIGRFCRDLEAQLVRHVAGPQATLDALSITQQLLVSRLIKTTVQLNGLDDKLANGTWTDLDARTHHGLVNRQRLLLRDLGLRPTEAAKPVPSMAAWLRGEDAA